MCIVMRLSAILILSFVRCKQEDTLSLRVPDFANPLFTTPFFRDENFTPSVTSSWQNE